MRSSVSVRAVWLWVVLALLCSLPVARAAPPRQTTPPTLEEYQQLLNATYVAAQRSDRIGLDESAAKLLAVAEVRLPDGDTAPVNNEWLRVGLAQEPPDYPVLMGRLGAILDALGQERTPTEADALQKLDQVFEVPPFKSREVPSAWNDFWDGVSDAIGRFFERLFAQMPTPAVTPNPVVPASFGTLTPVGWLLLFIGILLILALIIYVIRSVRRSIVAEAKVRAEIDEEETLTAREAGDRAVSAAQAGDYRTATRHLYLSTLLWLEERSLVRYDRSRTNREYLAQLRGKPAYDTFVPVVETFERVWYGQRPLDAEDFRAYEQQVETLRAREERPS